MLTYILYAGMQHNATLLSFRTLVLTWTHVHPQKMAFILLWQFLVPFLDYVEGITRIHWFNIQVADTLMAYLLTSQINNVEKMGIKMVELWNGPYFNFTPWYRCRWYLVITMATQWTFCYCSVGLQVQWLSSDGLWLIHGR